jgi:peptidyl-prolyl cis-trans isomerase C
MPAALCHRALSVRHRLLQGSWRCGVLGVLGVLLVAGCGKQETKPEAGVLAQGDGWTIRAEDFRHAWAARPGPADSPQARSEALEQMIERAVLAQAARKAGIDRDPETAARLEALLITRLRDLQLEPKIKEAKVSDAELRAAYEVQRETAFTQPAALRVAVLWFNTRGQQPLTDRYRPRLEEIRGQILADPGKFPVAAGFGPLAVGNTEHRPSRLLGGDLGWLDLGTGVDPWRDAVLAAAANLVNPGDLGEITAGPQGLFLVRLTERREARVQPFEEVRPNLEQRLLSERRREIEDRFTRSLVNDAPVQRFPDQLSTLAPLTAAPAPAAPDPPLPHP